MLDILIIVIAVALILLSLLQGGKSDGISGAFTGNGGLNLFQNVKERGPEKVIADFYNIISIVAVFYKPIVNINLTVVF